MDLIYFLIESIELSENDLSIFRLQMRFYWLIFINLLCHFLLWTVTAD